MGVPKFFRYISERYPCLSEIVREYQIPEFDNLYLDMNGIIHMCSHPDDGNPHFRITEEKIIQDIFHYIEVLFRMIRPQKLFFMAVDGVAPRAKMNQQRGRRFRSAKDAQKQESDATKRGEKLPEEARFDSNCITPGTVFMARLHEQLKYFVVDKISHDPTWQKCKVVLSGHETPGEGEHKIMDYIRYLRAQPGYDPNTRHCLYGLDADLIMLGLCTHEPHFSLLREEVKFGKKSTKRMSVPEEITFYLLHLSLMREYLELEFAPLKDKLEGYEYDLEKIIDDWVLMGFLVGNDFIPHLPNLHIADGALPVLYNAYMEALPTLDGYINEAGTLNLVRFEKFMEKLSNIDLANFEEVRDDLLYMEAKTGKKWNSHTKVSTKPLHEGVGDGESRKVPLESLEPEKSIDSGLAALVKETDDMCLDSAEETEDQSEEDDAFENYKKDYYRNKMEYSNVTPQVMRAQAEGYVRAIQWNLNYYYNGCCSWSWYYPHHYAPYISDIKGFSNLKIEFDSGRPFLPYEQLLAVLPAASKDLLPYCYHHLMVDDDSAIKQYYPEDFQTDLNGKKQEWEAVVLVPFIDENVLLEAMRSCNDYLTAEEERRNMHGPMMIYTYSSKDMGPYPAPEYFPPITHNYTEVTTMAYDDVLLPKEKLVKGAYPGVRMDVYYPGFPTMKHLKYKATLQHAKVRVFEHPSRNANMIITIIPKEKFAGDMIPVDLLGTSVFVGWPHLTEAKVVSISNSKRKYISMGGPNQYNVEERTGHLIPQFKQEVEGMTEYYQRRMGIDVGETKVLVHVQLMIGRKYVFAPNGRLTLEKQFTQNIANYPLQTVVFDICAYDPTQTSVFKDAESVFPKGCTCFTLTNPYYGSEGVVQDSKQLFKNGRIKICISVFEEPDFSKVKEVRASITRSYRTLFHAASQLSMTNLLFSRITGSIFVITKSNEGSLKNANIGLDLKYNKKNKETPGHTKKIGTTWYYTDRVVDLVRLYSEKYPEVFDYLCQDDRRDDINAEWLFKEDCDEKVKEVVNWLKSLPVYSLERQTCDSEVAEPEVVEEIEKTIDGYSKSSNSKKVTMQIKPNFLYRPEVQNGTLMPDPKTETRVLDRIVNVRSGFTVPLGLKGTVILVHKPAGGSDRDIMYDVVFDKPFSGGMKINCSEDRGYRLPKTAFVNISYGQRLMEEKTGKPDEVIAKAEASHTNTSNYNTFSNFQAQNYSNNFAPQHYNQYPQQQLQNQQWYPPQYPPQYSSVQQEQSFQKESSAFAQFTHVTEQRQPLLDTPYSDSLQSQEFYNSTVNNRQTKQQSNQQQNYQNNSNNGFFSYQKGNNNFMPAFTNKSQPQEGSKQQAQQSPQKRHPQQKADENKELPARNQSDNVKRHPQHQQKADENKELPARNQSENVRQRPRVHTEFLKTILKIRNEANRNKENKQSNLDAPPVASTSQEDVPKEEKTDNISFDMFAQAAKAPASVRLLTYYQSNGLGLPRYQYFNCGDLIQSQITMASSGDVIIGKPATSREEASENVAADALEIFMKKAREDSDNTQITEGFPIPPKTWVQPQSNADNSQDDEDQQETDAPVDNTQTTTVNKSKSDTTLLNNSLVPLQAIARHLNKVNNTSNRQVVEGGSLIEKDVEGQISTEVSDGDHKNIQNIEDHGASLQRERKAKGRRRMRIAANFVSSEK